MNNSTNISTMSVILVPNATESLTVSFGIAKTDSITEILDGPSGADGPSISFYGEWVNTTQYPLSTTHICVVCKTNGTAKTYFTTQRIDKYNGLNHTDKYDPVNGAPWEEFQGNFQSVATNLLMAENAYINMLSSNSIVVKNSSNIETAGMSGKVTGTSGIRFWAGATEADKATAPFVVDELGNLVANKATITGTINADGGYIGGFSIMKVGDVAYLKNSDLKAVIELESETNNSRRYINIGGRSGTLISMRLDGNNDNAGNHGIYIQSYGSGNKCLSILANKGGKYAIESFGPHRFGQREGECWSEPGVIWCGEYQIS